MMVMMMMMTERRRDGCISKIFFTVFQREEKKKIRLFWLYLCDLSQLGSSGVGLEALAGAGAVQVSPGNVSL